MIVRQGLEESLDLPRPVVTIGSFDGIHRGHQALVARVMELAQERDGSSVLITFEPHPQQVIQPSTAPDLLTTSEEKLALLDAAGLDATVVIRFDRAMSQMEAEDFVQQVLVEKLGVDYLVFGYDHAFGRGRRGRPDLLRRMAPGLGFELEVMTAVTDGGETIASRTIREHLSEGRVRRAAELLGRPYGLHGLVVKGDRRGSSIGFPTANLAPSAPEKLVPGRGAYAVLAEVRGRRWMAAGNIGVRPTFEGVERTIEVHLLDFEEEIYGEVVEMIFIDRLRDERSFESPEALREQIGSDVAEARRILRQEVG